MFIYIIIINVYLYYNYYNLLKKKIELMRSLFNYWMILLKIMLNNHLEQF